MFSENNNDIPIQGANVYWENSDIGTITNQNGGFNIKLLLKLGSRLEKKSDLTIEHEEVFNLYWYAE